MEKKNIDSMKWIRRIREKNAKKLLRMTEEELREYFQAQSEKFQKENDRLESTDPGKTVD